MRGRICIPEEDGEKFELNFTMVMNGYIINITTHNHFALKRGKQMQNPKERIRTSAI